MEDFYTIPFHIFFVVNKKCSIWTIRPKLFVQPNAITRENIPLLLILDALKLLREIPATSPDDCVRGVARLIAALSEGDLEKLADLAENYQPYVRALLGAILDSLGADTRQLRATLNGVTTYKLPVTAQALPTKLKWNIV